MAGKKKDITPEQAAADRAELDTLTAQMLVADETKEDQLPANQQEREALIAEAYKLTGRIEGLEFIVKTGAGASLMLLRKIKEEKVYKSMPGVGTWENYCNSIGLSRRKVDEDLQNLEAFGNDFLALSRRFFLDRDSLRQLRSAAGDGKLEITDNTIVIASGDIKEIIPLDDKDEVKDALERLLTAKDKQLEIKQQELKAKDKIAKSKDDTINNLSKELAAFEAKAEVTGLTADEQKFIRNIQNIKILITGQLIKLESQNLPTLSPSMEKEYKETVFSIWEHIAGINKCSVTLDEYRDAEPELPCEDCANEPECGRHRFYSTGADTYACDNKKPKGE